MPWVLIGSMLSIWLKELRVSRTDIGFAGFILSAYTFNFLWSPLLDHIQPKLAFLRGRQAWIALCQLAMALVCFFLFRLNPSTEQAVTIVGLCLCIAIASATQDIAIDAFRVDAFSNTEKDKIVAAASVATAGWYTGYAGLGAIPGYLSDLGWSWPTLYLSFSVLSILIYFIAISISPEKRIGVASRQATEDQSKTGYGAWIKAKVFEPLRDFFARHGLRFALGILFFIFLFKIGESFLGRMSIVFYKEMGYTNTDIANYSKLMTWLVTTVAAFSFGLISQYFGTIRQLIIAGLAMALSNLMFIAIHQTGPSIPLYMLTAIIDGITATWATVAFVAFISRLCSHQFSATQYALMASIGTLGRTIFSGFSGVVIDGLNGNWTIFFLMTIAMVLPALILLLSMRKDIERTLSE